MIYVPERSQQRVDWEKQNGKLKAPGLYTSESQALEQPSPRTAHECEINTFGRCCKANLGNLLVTIHLGALCGKEVPRCKLNVTGQNFDWIVFNMLQNDILHAIDLKI
jgi:hypothetical protein